MKTIDHLNILAVGRNAAIMAVVERLLNSHDAWYGLAVTNDGAAVQALQQTPFDIVLLCAGITKDEEAALRKQLLLHNADLIIAQHYGGGSGLLEAEIRNLLAEHHITLTL